MILWAQRLSAVRPRARARLKAPAAAVSLSTSLPWVHNATSWSSNSNSDASSRPSSFSSSVVLDEPIASSSTRARVSTFLEDVSDEYGYDAAAEEQRALQQFLSDAVKRGDYASANSLRERMVDSGFEIMHDNAYAGVAEHFLRLCTTLTGARTKSSSSPSSTFAHAMAWWSLVPPLSLPVTAHTASTSSTSTSIPHETLDGLTTLLISPDLPISYTRTFTLALASKGYMKPIQKPLVARIVSFSNPEHIAPFLRGLDRWDAAFSSGTATKNGSSTNSTEEDTRLLHGNIRRRSAARWSLTVRTQAFAGRIVDSARLLLEFCRGTAGDDEKRMFNFHAVLASARRGGLDEDTDVRRVWKVASEVLGRRRYARLKKLVKEDGTGFHSSSMVKGKEIMPPDPWDVPEGEGYSPQSANAAELFLSPTIPSNSFPHTSSLAAWLASHDELGSRDQADALLDAWVSLDSSAHSTPGSSSRTPHKSGRAQSRAAAEMYLALSRDEPERAMQVFVRSFRSEGVPGRRILEILTGSDEVGERDFLESGTVAFSRVSVGGRMMPSRHVVTILVGAILASIPKQGCRTALRREGLTRAEAAKEVYSDLIRALSPSISLPPSSSVSSLPSSSTSTSQLHPDSDISSSPRLIESIPQRMLPSSDSALFTPLLSSPYFSSFPSQHSILSSMHALKIPLSRQVLTKVIRAAAQEGHAELVKGVISGMGQDVDRVVWLNVMSGIMTGRQWELGTEVLEWYRRWETESGRLRREDEDAKTVDALGTVVHRLESAVALYTAKKHQTVQNRDQGL